MSIVSHLIPGLPLCSFFFFFNDTATTEIYTLSLHDALPIYFGRFIRTAAQRGDVRRRALQGTRRGLAAVDSRSEEHTSELQSRQYLVCRLLLEKKKQLLTNPYTPQSPAPLVPDFILFVPTVD